MTKLKLIKIAMKYCANAGICRSEHNQCKPLRCAKFKALAVPCWFRDIKRRHKSWWERCGEYKEYQEAIKLL